MPIKNRFIAFNILIAVLQIIGLAIGLMFTFAYRPPTDLKQKTGFVAKFKQYDEKWYDYILGGSQGSYFRVWLDDNSYFEATGMSYDNIDRRLFEHLQKGEEITITYFKKGGIKKIFALEYKGKTYLSIDDVLNDYKKSEKIARIVGPTILVITTSLCVFLFIINYKKNRIK